MDTLDVHDAISCGSNVIVMLSCTGQIDVLSYNTNVIAMLSWKEVSSVC